jgi:GNAT superfamily N-acetyltransferase
MARKIRSLTPARVADLPGQCGCCGFWESADAPDPGCGAPCDPESLRAWVSRVTREWGDCGRIAYVEGEAIGFAKYAPARFFPQVARMPAGLPSEDAVLLACLHVEADVRHSGVGKVLVQAVLRDVASRGEKVVEAYAAIDVVDRKRTPMMTVEFLLRQGFTVVRPHPRYPLMRLELKTLAAWTENIEAVLESLQLPVLGRERLPEPAANCRARRCRS